MADHSLSELCSICYANVPKYRCPRCRTQTCSLPCYKRHQQRASCNGQRNPAAYVKKSQWQTPAGIDHDYNYLKSVERTLTQASESVPGGGGGSGSGGDGPSEGYESKHERNVAKAWRTGSALQRYLVQNHIDVLKAPKGMSRQVANMTRVTNGQRVLWSVDWVDAEGKVLMKDDESAADGTVEGLWTSVSTRLRNAEKKRQNADRLAEANVAVRGAKRRRMSVEGEGDDHATASAIKPQAQDSVPAVVDNVYGNLSSTQPDKSANDADSTDATSIADTKRQNAGSSPQDRNDINDPTTDIRKHFYLHKPRTSSKLPVLIPLDPKAKLTACLTGRIVLEYPTIYVLETSADTLPAQFVLEQDYVKTRQAEDQELTEMITATGSHDRAERIDRSDAAEAAQLDSNAILEMLKRDVNV